MLLLSIFRQNPKRVQRISLISLEFSFKTPLENRFQNPRNFGIRESSAQNIERLSLERIKPAGTPKGES
jgi:hypothetical protein